jgi:pimeloyl-ACP methyl ester carboxylesterase
LLVLLTFYSTPAKSERVLLGSIFFFLSVDTITILAAYPIRHDESWIGIAAVLWALLVTAWAIMCDRVVEYGKHEVQERLTGCRETRRSFRQLCSIFGCSTLLIALLAITVLFTINLSIRARDVTLPAPGKMYFVDNHKYQVHVNCVGNKTDTSGHKVTTVFIEGGEDPVEGRIESWVADAYNDKAIQRYCYWDRPGMAWSDNAPSPLSAGMAVDALSEALTKSDESGPWILVSHGVGGIYSRIFASRHTANVQGLLLIDALHESLLGHIGSPGRGFLLWIRGVIYPLGIDRFVSAILLQHNRNDRVYGRDAYQNGGSIKAKLQECLVATTFTKNEITAAAAILPRSVPIVVVSSGKEVKKSKEWFEGQKSLGKLTDNLVAWDVVNGAGHDVWRNQNGRELLQKRLTQLVNRS